MKYKVLQPLDLLYQLIPSNKKNANNSVQLAESSNSLSIEQFTKQFSPVETTSYLVALLGCDKKAEVESLLEQSPYKEHHFEALHVHLSRLLAPFNELQI